MVLLFHTKKVNGLTAHKLHMASNDEVAIDRRLYAQLLPTDDYDLYVAERMTITLTRVWKGMSDDKFDKLVARGLSSSCPVCKQAVRREQLALNSHYA